MANWISAKVPRSFNGKRILFSTNDAGRMGHTYGKKMNLTLYAKINQKHIIYLNVGAKTIKYLVENIIENLWYCVRQKFFESIQRV